MMILNGGEYLISLLILSIKLTFPLTPKLLIHHKYTGKTWTLDCMICSCLGWSPSHNQTQKGTQWTPDIFAVEIKFLSSALILFDKDWHCSWLVTLPVHDSYSWTLQAQKMHGTQPQLPEWDSWNVPTPPVYCFFYHALKDTVSRSLSLVCPFFDLAIGYLCWSTNPCQTTFPLLMKMPLLLSKYKYAPWCCIKVTSAQGMNVFACGARRHENLPRHLISIERCCDRIMHPATTGKFL